MLSCLEQSLCAICSSVTACMLNTGKGGAKEDWPILGSLWTRRCLDPSLGLMLDLVLAYSLISGALVEGMERTGC